MHMQSGGSDVEVAAIKCKLFLARVWKSLKCARLKKRNSRCRRCRRRRAAFFPFRLLSICFQYKLRAQCAEQRGKKKLHRANNAPAGAADIIYQIYELLMPQTNTGASFSFALFRGVSGFSTTPNSLFLREQKLRPATTFQRRERACCRNNILLAHPCFNSR